MKISAQNQDVSPDPSLLTLPQGFEWWLRGDSDTRCSAELWRKEFESMGDKGSAWSFFSTCYDGFFPDYYIMGLQEEDLGKNEPVIRAMEKALDGMTRKVRMDESFYPALLKFDAEVLDGAECCVLLSAPCPPSPGSRFMYRHTLWGIIDDGRVYHRGALPELFEQSVPRRNDNHMSLLLREKLFRLGDTDEEVVETVLNLWGLIHKHHVGSIVAGLLQGLSLPDVNYRILKDLERRTRIAEKLEGELGPRGHEYAMCDLFREIEVRFPPLSFRRNTYWGFAAWEKEALKARENAVEDYCTRLKEHLLSGDFKHRVHFSIEPFEVCHKYESNVFRGIVIRCYPEDAAALFKRLQEFPRFM